VRPTTTSDEESDNRTDGLRTAHIFPIALVNLIDGASRIRHDDARHMHTVDLTPEEIECGELRKLEVAGMDRWVRLTIGGIVIHYAMVMDAAHSPPITFINNFLALVSGVRFGPNHIVRFGTGWEVQFFESALTLNVPCVKWPLALEACSHYFRNSDKYKADWLPDPITGALSASASHRLSECGIPEDDYKRHVAKHAHLHTATPHSPRSGRASTTIPT
jgi:hypothetical protein